MRWTNKRPAWFAIITCPFGECGRTQRNSVGVDAAAVNSSQSYRQGTVSMTPSRSSNHTDSARPCTWFRYPHFDSTLVPSSRELSQRRYLGNH
ncbi:hypothetical protein NEOLEDRAFT_1136742 [Neolentinus lepideus HHB14362 ss-1]|uniref:Uncharacterized protein n=1 Tax=Neolentinus lepideus HHB14362 ss-1 TaxID=1314782 RepID=A0A165R673_9AGAM|nr:hypothetical protein NEOLEDRAFT_1136742 [Neolentinus lepideus HHB14362 ss-1]